MLNKNKSGTIVVGDYKLLKWLIRKFGYGYSEEKRWQLIEASKPSLNELACEWESCPKPVYSFDINLAGEIHHAFCKTHWNQIKKHLRTLH